MCRKVTCCTVQVLLAESHCSARSLLFADVKVVPVFLLSHAMVALRDSIFGPRNPESWKTVAKCAEFKTLTININAPFHLEYREIIQLLMPEVARL